MAEDKKSDDYTVDMNKVDQGNKEFEAAPPPTPSPRASSTVSNNPAFPVLAYCGSSIMMTVMNKYVLSGLDFNLNFLLLCVQVCGGFCSLDPRRIANTNSLWSALLQFKHASPWVLSPSVISTPMRPESVWTPIIKG